MCLLAYHCGSNSMSFLLLLKNLNKPTLPRSLVFLISFYKKLNESVAIFDHVLMQSQFFSYNYE